MQLDSQTQAIMLLTVTFGKAAQADVKPLSGEEWNRFAGWLKDQKLEPSHLIEETLTELLADWQGVDRHITLPRLGRGGAMGLAVEKWQRAGVWVLTRSDPDYPVRLKQRLKGQSPPVLFGCGSRRLLNQGGVAVVGSRHASESDLDTTSQLGAEIASRGHSVVSGGARGVDQCAMLGALEREGTAVGVLADSLLRAATSAMYRKHLASGNLVLVSPFNPEAGFHVGNAMGRNRYIYCLADRAVVISSSLDKGGTWQGATQALQAGWVPLWVMAGGTAGSGNPELIRRGGQPWEPGDFAGLFDSQESASTPSPDTAHERGGTLSATHAEQPAQNLRAAAAASRNPHDEFYALFLRRLEVLTSEEALSTEAISKQFNLKQTQVEAWLKQGVGEKRIRKLSRPARYRYEKQQAGQQLNLPVAVSSGLVGQC